MERDALAARLTQVEAEIEKPWATAASVNEVAERATNVTAAQAAAQEKAALEVKVVDLERNLATTRVDLVTANRLRGSQPAPGGLRGGDEATKEQHQVVSRPRW
jgi:hypothetical protein